MIGLLQDLRYGVRLLLKSPGYTAAAVATLAIGIGATTAIASVVGAVLLRPLPYPEADRVVMVWDSKPSRGWDRFAVSPGNYADYEAAQRSFEAIAAFEDHSAVITGGGDPERLIAVAATTQFAGITGLVPTRGRGFAAEEYGPGAARVAILTDAIWQRRWGGRGDLLGSAITLDSESHTVIGILPPGALLPDHADILLPRAFSAEERERHGSHWLTAMARLKPGATLASATADLKAIAARLEKDRPDTNSGWSATLVPLYEETVGDVRPALLALAGAVACLLLLACANVANLVLARSATRRAEIALRAALGAGRGRLMRQLLTESLILALFGGAVGVLLGWWGVDLIRVFRPANLPRIEGLAVDGRVLALALGVSILSGILFGTAPGLLLARARLAGDLQEGGRGLRGRMSGRVRATLVAAQVALALVLLVGTGLQVRSLARLLEVNPGFDPNNVLMLEVSLPERRYPDGPARFAFHQRLLDGFRALPGVMAADQVTTVPASDRDLIFSIEVEGRPQTPDQSQSANWYAVSPGYFETMRIPLVAGRGFDAHDVAGGQRVALVNDIFARRIFPGEDPIGKRLKMGIDSDATRTIVGVVGSVRQYGLDQDATMQMYDPAAQLPGRTTDFVLRTATDPGAMVNAARGVVLAADPDQAVSSVSTLNDLLDYTTAQRRFSLALLALFAGAALLLAAVGVYGVVAYGVSQRTHEIGVRMALGAERRAILSLILRQGMMMTLAGVAVGLCGSLALTRVIRGLLYGVGAADPITYVVTATMMCLVAFLATWVPALRATRVEPTAALRSE